ncbi:hypothetical protein EU523_01420 [Candidatus Heimdallarchaeota archaeon]|nr:MAG: hypothetical protein EU523_01420 [Candidatus Heimdallarchaeota archaeon]
MNVSSITTDDSSFEQSKEEVIEQQNNIQNTDNAIQINDGLNSVTDTKEEQLKESQGNTLLVELAGGAILGALSILLGLINQFLPEIPVIGGMKIFDLIALPMMVAFLIFGIKAGLLSTVIGCLGILTHGSSTAWIGMTAKFLATLPMIIVPWLLLRFGDKLAKRISFLPQLTVSSQSLKKSFTYLIIPSILFRVILMFAVNLLFTLPLFTHGAISLSNDPKKALLFATIYGLWNIVQGIVDAYLAWIVTYPTQFDKLFGTW